MHESKTLQSIIKNNNVNIREPLQIFHIVNFCHTRLFSYDDIDNYFYYKINKATGQFIMLTATRNYKNNI